MMGAEKNPMRRWLVAAGIIVSLLGLVHNALVFNVFATGFESLKPQDKNSAIWLFLVTGTAVFFAGLAILYPALQKERSARRTALKTAFGAWVFLALIMTSAVPFMPKNPGAYAGLVVMVFAFVVLISCHRRIQKERGA